MKSYKELREEIAAKSKSINDIFEEAGPDRDFTKIKSIEGDTKGKVEKVQSMLKELEDLNDEIEQVKSLDSASKRASELSKEYNQPATKMSFPNPGDAKLEVKTLGQLIMEKKGELRPNGSPITVPFEVKTLFETAAGWAPESIRLPGAVLAPARALVVADYVPQAPTTQAAIVYMLETTANFAATEKAEGTAYAEAEFALTETIETVRKITTSLPVTDEQLADVPAAEAYINQRLGYDIRRILDNHILEGDGGATPPEVKGTLNIGGSLQTQALGTDSRPDAIYKAFDKIRTVGFAEPSVLFINPADWQPVRLLVTADGIYIFGSPQDAGADRIWGKPVVQTTGVTANTAICGDYTGFSTLYVRSGLEVSMGYVDDDFTKGKKTLRADMRCAMVHFRDTAFCTITGL